MLIPNRFPILKTDCTHLYNLHTCIFCSVDIPKDTDMLFIVATRNSCNSTSNCFLRRYLLLFNTFFYTFTVMVAICGSYHCIATRSGTCDKERDR